MLYTTVGTWLTTSAFGKRLMQLEFRVLQKAGDLRFSLLRTRENSGAAPNSSLTSASTPALPLPDALSLFHLASGQAPPLCALTNNCTHAAILHLQLVLQCGALPSMARLGLCKGPLAAWSECGWCAESIAFYRGEAREVAMTAGRLQSLVTTARQRVAWAAGLSLWSNCYTYVTILMPSLLTAPRYFAGEVEFGVITQVLLPAGIHTLELVIVCLGWAV